MANMQGAKHILKSNTTALVCRSPSTRIFTAQCLRLLWPWVRSAAVLSWICTYLQPDLIINCNPATAHSTCTRDGPSMRNYLSVPWDCFYPTAFDVRLWTFFRERALGAQERWNSKCCSGRSRPRSSKAESLCV